MTTEYERVLASCETKRERELVMMYWAGDGAKAWWNRGGKYDVAGIVVLAMMAMFLAHKLLGVDPVEFFRFVVQSMS